MVADLPDPPFLAITAAGMFHVAPDADTLRVHMGIEPAVLREIGGATAYELYDSEGRPLGPTDTADGLRLLAQAAEPTDADRAALVGRIDAAVTRMQIGLDQVWASAPNPPPSRHVVPRVSGELIDVLIALGALQDIGNPVFHDAGNWFHNLGHSVFG